MKCSPPDARLALFSIFDVAVWLAAFAVGVAILLALRGSWLWLVCSVWLFIGTLILRHADARAAHFDTLRRNLR